MPKRHLFVRGFWGPRKEAADECAARWLAFFERLSRVAPPAFAGWRSAEDNEPPVDLDHESLTALAMRLTDDERLDMGIGFRLSAWCERPGWPRVDFSATAGSESDNPRVRNSVVLTLFARSDADIGQWSPLLGEALLALAEEWEPDWGDVGTHSLWDAQEQAAAISVIAPRSGLVTYLSPGRSAAMPSGLPGRHIRTRDGGTLISLVTAEGLLPALDVAVELDQALRASPAFAPTPTSRPRL